MRNYILSTKLTPDQIALFYLGQEGFLIKWQDTYILIDGYLTDYVDRNGSTERVKWIRRYDAPISPRELDFVDYVFCTHSHADHADPDTLSGIYSVNAKAVYIVPHILKDTLLNLGISKDRIRCMDGDETAVLGNVSVTAIPAAHEQLSRDENGHAEALGYILRFGSVSLYHAGDCCIYDGLAERLSGIDIGLLPINGRDYFRTSDDIIGNMDSREAVVLAQKAKFQMMIPMHFDLYAVNDVNPAYFVDCLYRFNPTQKFHMFVPGERFLYAAEDM